MATKSQLVASIKWRKNKGQFGFRLIASNGEVVHPSEKYTRKENMMQTINRWNKDTFKKPVPVIECDAKWQPIKSIGSIEDWHQVITDAKKTKK